MIQTLCSRDETYPFNADAVRSHSRPIRAKAPVRISFAGGGTDVSPFPETEGGTVLSATIDRFVHASLCPHSLGHVNVESVDYGLSLALSNETGFEFDGNLDLVKAAIRRVWRDEEPGYSLVLSSATPPGSGLGSSSAVIVALVAALNEHHDMRMTRYDIARAAAEIEREDLRIEGGLQDHYAAAFGGFNFIEFSDHVIANPLRIQSDTIAELEMNLMLCYTGVTRRSDGIISDQTARLKDEVPDTLRGLRAQKELAVAMKNALLKGELDEFGWLLGQAWEAKKKMSPKISTELSMRSTTRRCALVQEVEKLQEQVEADTSCSTSISNCATRFPPSLRNWGCRWRTLHLSPTV